ncbi:MAG: hypothetical protein ACTSVU_04500 [Promethearchaeota archaeon]
MSKENKCTDDDSDEIWAEIEHKVENLDVIGKTIRINWLDQLRGGVILLYTIGVMAYALRGDLASGVLPVGATYYNHGWAESITYFYLSESKLDFPSIITIIDIGEPLLRFLIGMMAAYSFRRRMNNNGKYNAWGHALNRFVIFLFLSVLLEDMFLDRGIFEALFNGVFATIAWASIAGSIMSAFVEKADLRVIIGIGLAILHAILYAIPIIRFWHTGSDLWYFAIPWNMLNNINLGITGAGYCGYIFPETAKTDQDAFKKRILPLTVLFLLGNYLMDYLQFADNFNCTTSLVFLTLGFAGVLLFVFHQISEIGFKIPFLSSWGKNMLLIFLFSTLIEWIWAPIIVNVVRNSHILALLLAGVVPLLVLEIIVWGLDRKGIVVKI